MILMLNRKRCKSKNVIRRGINIIKYTFIRMHFLLVLLRRLSVNKKYSSVIQNAPPVNNSYETKIYE